MESIKRKIIEQENSYTSVLKTLIKQKEEIANKFKRENDQLKKLLFQQQNLLNKLNEDNMQLNKHYNDCNANDRRFNLTKNKYKPKNFKHDETDLFETNEFYADPYEETHDIEREQKEEHL